MTSGWCQITDHFFLNHISTCSLNSAELCIVGHANFHGQFPFAKSTKIINILFPTPPRASKAFTYVTPGGRGGAVHFDASPWNHQVIIISTINLSSTPNYSNMYRVWSRIRLCGTLQWQHAPMHVDCDGLFIAAYNINLNCDSLQYIGF